MVLVLPVAGPWMSHERVHLGDGPAAFEKLGREHYLAFHFRDHLRRDYCRGHLSLPISSGALIGAALYLANYVVFALALGYKGSKELHVCIEHIVFGLFFAAAYKATSVPRPRWKATGGPVVAEETQ